MNGVLDVVEPLGTEIILVVLQENLILKGAHLEAVLPTALIWTPVNGGVQQAEHKFGLDGTLCLSSIKKPLEKTFSKPNFFFHHFYRCSKGRLLVFEEEQVVLGEHQIGGAPVFASADFAGNDGARSVQRSAVNDLQVKT